VQDRWVTSPAHSPRPLSLCCWSASRASACAPVCGRRGVHPVGARDHIPAMGIEGISLQRISLGALVIALGLLVDGCDDRRRNDDRKLEEGFNLFKAATLRTRPRHFPC